MLSDYKFKQEQKRDQIRNHIRNLKFKLPTSILEMTLGHMQELFHQNYKTYDQVEEHMNNKNVLTNITNQTLNSLSMSVKKVSSNADDGEFLWLIFFLLHIPTLYGGLVLFLLTLFSFFYAPCTSPFHTKFNISLIILASFAPIKYCSNSPCISHRKIHHKKNMAYNAGYITGDSVRSNGSKSARQLGPFQSAKAKSRRRSRSLSSVVQSAMKSAMKTQQTMNRNNPRESRSRYRTPLGNRIQSISADRMMNPVTPKCEAGRSVTMLRYAKQGETVISLQGSPVVAPK